MRKLILSILVFGLVFKYAYCEDNLLAIDTVKPKEKDIAQENKVVPKEGPNDNNHTSPVLETPLPEDDSDKDLKKIKVYREFIDNKQKELELIKIDLEKSSLLLKKKEAEKEIYEIDKTLPQSKKEDTLESSAFHDLKPPPVEGADIKILLLLISDNLKQGIITLKGTPYSFKQGDCIAGRLTVENIDSSGVSFKQKDGEILKLNFIN